MVLGLLNTADAASSGGGLPSPSQQPARIEVGETEAEGQRCTLVKVAANTPVSFRDITPVFEDLGINIVSFGTDRQLGGAIHSHQKKHLQAFRGSFLVTDDDGECLQEDLIKALVAALQRVLHVSFTTSALRKSDSIGSNLSNASTAPDTPGAGTRNAGLQGAEARLQYSSGLSRAQPDNSSNSSTPTANSGGTRFTASARGGSCEVVLSMQLPHSHDTRLVQPPHRRATSELGDPHDTEGEGMLLARAGSDLTANRQLPTLGGLSAGSLQQHEQLHATPAGTMAVATAASGPSRPMSVSRQPSSSSAGTASQDMSDTGQVHLPPLHSPGTHQPAPSAVSAISGLLGIPPAVLGPAFSIASTDASQQLGTLTISSSGFTDRAASLTRQLSLREDDILELAAGQQTVDSIMKSPVQSIHMNADLVAAKALMSQFQISALLVDTGTPTPGFITKRDFLKVSFSKTLKNARVKDVMTQPAICIHQGASLREAVQLIAAKGVRRILVHDASRESPTNFLAPYTGLVSDTDIFRVLGSSRARQEEAAAEQQVSQQAAVQQQEVQSQGIDNAQQRASPGRIQQLQPHQSTGSTISMNSLAMSISSISEQAKHFSTEERYRAAAALWELEFSEIEVLRRIGEGSFGEVMLANFRGTKVAVKRMRGFELPSMDDGPGPSPTMMPVFAQFFEREIEIMATIRHPNVVTFIGACHTPPNVCLVTEYCARGSLDHLLHKSGLHLDLTKKIEFAMDIARGMSCLHAQRPAIIHRDLKTANLLVSARFEVKVSDFGLSRIKDHAQLINSRAGLEGTVEYCAPEVLRGEPYTEKCDVWSFGVVLWELVNRQRPYADADVPVYILMMALGAGSLRLPALRDEVSTPGLVRLVERCFAWQPADRPSFREVLHALENEYKVVRGKAAAVPRSDSASSMVVLGQHAQHGESAEVTLLQPGHSQSPAAGSCQPVIAAPPAAPAPPIPAHAAGTAPRAPVCLRVPVPSPPFLRQPRSPGRSGDGGGDAGSTERHSGHAPTSRFAPANSGGLAAGTDGQNVAVGLRSSNSQSGTGHGTSRAAGPMHMANTGPNGKGRPPRPRRLSRARSTPLPEHIWFHEPTSYEDEDEGMDSEQPQHSSKSGNSPATGQSSVVTMMHSSGYPLTRLTNIPELGSVHEAQGYDSGSSVSSPRTTRSTGAAGAALHAEKPSSSLRGWGGMVVDSEPETSPQKDTSATAGEAMESSPSASQTSAVQTPAPHVHVWSSPFDGFLPFSEEDPQSPDTPKMQSGVNNTEHEAATRPGAAGSGPASSDLATLDGAVIQLAAALAASSSSLASDALPAAVPTRLAQFSSPFSAYSQMPQDLSDDQQTAGSSAGSAAAVSAVPAPTTPSPVQSVQPASGARTGNFYSPFANLPSFDDMPTEVEEEQSLPQTAAEPAPREQGAAHASPASSSAAPSAGPYLCEFDTAAAGIEGSGFLEGSSQPPAAGDEHPSFLDITMSGLVQPHLSMLNTLHAPETLGSESPSTPPTGVAATFPQLYAAANLSGRGDSGMLTHSTQSDNTTPLNLATSMSMCLSMDSPAHPAAIAANLQAAGLHPHALPHVMLARSSAGGKSSRSGPSPDLGGSLMRVSPVAAGKHSKDWDTHGTQPGSPGPGSASGRRGQDVRATLQAGGSNGGADPSSSENSGSVRPAVNAAGGASSTAQQQQQQQQGGGNDDEAEALTVHQVAWVKV